MPGARRTLLACALVAALAACAAQKREPEMPTKPLQVADLIGSQWIAEDIGGGGVIDGSHSTLHFAAPNQVDGDTGCNLFRGPLASEGQTIRLGPLATTRRACAPAMMDQERRYLTALARAASLRRDGTLLILLDDGQRPLVRYSRVDPTAIPTRP